MTDRWFDDMPEHDPNDPDAVERALRRQERALRRQDEGAPKRSGRRSVLGSGQREHGSRKSRSRRGGSRSGGGSGGIRKGRVAALAVAVVCLIGRMSEGRIELSAISGTAGVEVMLTPTPPTFEKTPGDHVWQARRAEPWCSPFP